jgi:hypothetical protein
VTEKSRYVDAQRRSNTEPEQAQHGDKRKRGQVETAGTFIDPLPLFVEAWVLTFPVQAHLHSQLAQLSANLSDTENLLRMTSVQAEAMRGLGSWHGGL